MNAQEWLLVVTMWCGMGVVGYGAHLLSYYGLLIHAAGRTIRIGRGRR